MKRMADNFRLTILAAVLGELVGVLAFSTVGNAAELVRHAEGQGGMEMLDGQGVPWLVQSRCGVRLTDGTGLYTDDTRYRSAVTVQDNRTTVQWTDTRKQLDQTWVITSLDDQSVTVALTIINRSSEPFALEAISPLEGTSAARHDPARPHILLNGDSMSKPHPTVLRPDVTQLDSRETIALESPSLAAGFLTGKHNLNRFKITGLDGQPRFLAYGDCDGCLLMPGASRQSDLLFVSLHDRPLEQLERYATLAGRINGKRNWPPRIAWCSWYAGWMHAKMATYKNGLEAGVVENIPQVKKYFLSRGGDHTMRICDDYQPHGDWLNKTGTIPNGFDRLARLISEAGIIPGVWYPTYWASTDSNVVKEHPEWFAQNPDGSIHVRNPWNRARPKRPTKKPAASGQANVTTSPESSGTVPTLMKLYGAPGLAVFDTSRPDVQQYFEDTARTWRERGFRYVTNDYLQYGMLGPKYHDPTMTKVEILRKGMEAIRRGLGDEVFYRTIGGPLGVRLGLADDVRISGDSHGDNPSAYFRTAGVWFYNHRTWLNDPSAIVCARYGELRPIEWNRMWMSWIAMAGTVMTYGEVLDELPAEYIAMYQRLFPPLNCAGRPLDLWENEPYMLWGMAPGEADGPYTLFGAFDVTGKMAGTVRLNLDEIAARSRGWEKPATAPAGYVLWDFWNAALLRSEAERIDVELQPKSGRIFALRPRLGRPQLLGTSGHFSQGLLETEAIAWDAAAKTLEGKTRGNGGDPTTLYFLVPESMRLIDAHLGGSRVEPAAKEPGVLALAVPATDKPLDFALRFEGTEANVSERPFVAGRCATCPD